MDRNAIASDHRSRFQVMEGFRIYLYPRITAAGATRTAIIDRNAALKPSVNDLRKGKCASVVDGRHGGPMHVRRLQPKGSP